MIRSFAAAAAVLLALAGSAEVLGRGFGGGGYHGGGYRGGGFHEGGYHAEGFHGGEGGYRGGEGGGYRGMPSDGGMHSVSSSRSRDGYTVDRGAAEGPRGGVAAGDSVTGARGNTLDRGAAVGPDGGVAAGRSATGAGGTRIAQGVAAGPEGRVAAGGVASGPEGAVAARGAAGDRYGAVAGFGYRSPSARYGTAYGVRAGFGGYGLYTPGWYGANPGAWAGAGLAAAAWNGANWNTLNGWFGTSAAPMDYNYGGNVVAQDDNVYVDGQDAGTAQAYYEQAANLAQAGADAAPSADQNWLPLGVFAMTQGDQTNSNMVIQLAVSKQGIIRGNFTDTRTNHTLPVQGSIDKKTQRAAWTIGEKKNDVIDTGLYNLTKDEVPALLHYGKDRTEQWMLVRVKQNGPRPSQN